MSGEYDAGAVSSTALARMHAAGLVAPESVRVFWTSPGYSHCCFTVHSDTDRALARQITHAFVSMQYDDPLGKPRWRRKGVRPLSQESPRGGRFWRPWRKRRDCCKQAWMSGEAQRSGGVDATHEVSDAHKDRAQGVLHVCGVPRLQQEHPDPEDAAIKAYLDVHELIPKAQGTDRIADQGM